MDTKTVYVHLKTHTHTDTHKINALKHTHTRILEKNTHTHAYKLAGKYTKPQIHKINHE